MVTTLRGETGAHAESMATEFLCRRGLAIVERRWPRRCGELDIIARDGDRLAFGAVPLRKRSDFGAAAESITATQRARAIAAAGHHLASITRAPPCRFDAILLDALDASRIDWRRNVIET
jgi:putative endonuclease